MRSHDRITDNKKAEKIAHKDNFFNLVTSLLLQRTALRDKTEIFLTGGKIGVETHPNHSFLFFIGYSNYTKNKQKRKVNSDKTFVTIICIQLNHNLLYSLLLQSAYYLPFSSTNETLCGTVHKQSGRICHEMLGKRLPEIANESALEDT